MCRTSGGYWIKKGEHILNTFIYINFYYNLEVDEKKNPLLLFWLETSSPVIPQGSVALSIRAEGLNSLGILSIYVQLFNLQRICLYICKSLFLDFVYWISYCKNHFIHLFLLVPMFFKSFFLSSAFTTQCEQSSK